MASEQNDSSGQNVEASARLSDATAATSDSSDGGVSKVGKRRPRRKAASQDMRSRPTDRRRSRAAATSPQLVYHNLVMVEQSLREQYTALKRSTRKHTLFFGTLMFAICYFGYSSLLNPSIYGLVYVFDRLFFMASLLTLILFYLTGMYSQAFVTYPRFLSSTNKGLRGFNFRVVKVKPTWTERMLSLAWDPAYTSRPGRLVKLVLSPRHFSPQTIETWEQYRQAYWDRELELSCSAKTRSSR